MLDMTPLSARVSLLGVTPPNDFYDKIELYAVRLIEKNRVMNLTAVDEKDVIARHFSDSIEAAGVVDFSGRSIIDVGCGAGFPGLPLKLLFPSSSLTLLDSTAKKVAFLEELVTELGLDGVTCVAARAEEAAGIPDMRENFDFAVSRAVAAMPALLELCLPFVRVGGSFVAYKTARSAEEIETGRRAARLLGGRFAWERDYEVLAGAENRLIGVEKISQTPSKYPRKYSKIKKEPL